MWAAARSFASSTSFQSCPTIGGISTNAATPLAFNRWASVNAAACPVLLASLSPKIITVVTPVGGNHSCSKFAVNAAHTGALNRIDADSAVSMPSAMPSVSPCDARRMAAQLAWRPSSSAGAHIGLTAKTQIHRDRFGAALPAHHSQPPCRKGRPSQSAPDARTALTPIARPVRTAGTTGTSSARCEH